MNAACVQLFLCAVMTLLCAGSSSVAAEDARIAAPKPLTGTTNVAINPVIKKYVDDCWRNASDDRGTVSAGVVATRAKLIDLQEQEHLSDVQLAEQLFLVLAGRMGTQNDREETVLIGAQMVNFTQFGLGKPLGSAWFEAIAPYFESDDTANRPARELGFVILRAGMMLAPSPWGTEFQRDHSSLDALEHYLRDRRPEDHVNLLVCCFTWSPRATLRSVVATSTLRREILASCDELEAACRQYELSANSKEEDDLATAKNRAIEKFEMLARSADWRARAYAAATLRSTPYLRATRAAKILCEDVNKAVAKTALAAFSE